MCSTGAASVSLISVTALVIRMQVGWEGSHAGFFFLCFRPCACSFTSVPACGGGRGCKRLATLGGGACGMHTQAGREGGREFFFCASALVLVHLHFSRSVWGAGSASAFLLSAAALVVCIHVGREGGARFFCMCFGPCIFPITFLPECVGGRGCKPFSTLRGGACGLHTRGTGRRACEDVFLCFCPSISPFAFLLEFEGGRECKPFSTLGGGACGMHISGTGGRARFFCVVPHLYFPFAYLLECV